jgi:hypothetical protein
MQRDVLHLRQLLHLRLRLRGLAGLRAEAIDERLELLPLRRDLLRLREQPFVFFRALASIVLDVAAPGAHAFGLEGDHLVNLPIQEAAVMADEHHRLARALQERVEPGERRQVEVVRGFVEQQQVWILKQQTRQRRAHAPTA